MTHRQAFRGLGATACQDREVPAQDHRRATSATISSESSVEAACSIAAPHPLLSEIPPTLAPWLLPIAWDRERLWAIDRTPVGMELEHLRWLYALPLWRGSDRRWFRVSPDQFLVAPAAHPEHARRVADADLRFPIHVLWRRDRWMVLDGVHRLVKADLLGRKAIEAIVISAADIPSFARMRGDG